MTSHYNCVLFPDIICLRASEHGGEVKLMAFSSHRVLTQPLPFRKRYIEGNVLPFSY